MRLTPILFFGIPVLSTTWLARQCGAARQQIAPLLLVLVNLLATPTWSIAQTLAPGTVTAWGTNDNGEITVPADLSNVVSVVSGHMHSLALKSDGTVVAWGSNYYGTGYQGQAVVPDGLNSVAAVAAGGFHSLALKRDGTVVGWGRNVEGQINVAGITGVKAIAAGIWHSLALKTDGTVIAWGQNAESVPPGLSNVVAIAAGHYHNLALKSDGTVVAWGYNGDGQATVPAGLTDVKAIAAGYLHSVALKRDGSVVAWGASAQSAVPANATGVVAVAAGRDHALALKSDGTIVGWGSNIYGEAVAPPGLTGVNAIAAGTWFSTVANVLPTIPPYTFSGYFAPVNNPNVVNVGKAGRVYPVKWQLKDEGGQLVNRLNAVRSITAQPAQCGSFTGISDPLETTAAGNSGLTYDAVANQYVYNWSTPSPGCYTLTVTLDSGQAFPAYFNFNK